MSSFLCIYENKSAQRKDWKEIFQQFQKDNLQMVSWMVIF